MVEFLQQQATDQGLTDVTADCGEQAVLVQDADTTFTCSLVQGEDTQEVTLRIKDLQGTVAIES
ncbi:hypothetical protein [Nocardioides sp. URHA0020]|uniref:hypothetical protein n=1 Tax=Nocardioides sp. URHA0020 TaxID=1380392 RepID=UPI00048A910D|nr:hypothetical protein [Nocardioides sp. URHA0020]